MRVLIVGCGYVGLPLGRMLVAQGNEVFGLRRSTSAEAELREAGILPVTADITRLEELQHVAGPFDWVVNCAASGGGTADDYRRVYVEGMRNLVSWLSAAPPKKFVYTSSTSVYAQDDGAVVKESSATEPTAETSRVLLEAEGVLREAAAKGFPAVILRVAGIYGPGRGHLFRQFLNNELRIPGRGERFLNMIHRDDVAGAIVAALKSGRPGEIYNVVDDEPVAQIHFVRWLSETLGKWMPPFGPDDTAGERKRGLTSKKVSNRRLRMELGYPLKYPTFRQGYTEEIRRLEEAGELNIQPESRENL